MKTTDSKWYLSFKLFIDTEYFIGHFSVLIRSWHYRSSLCLFISPSNSIKEGEKKSQKVGILLKGDGDILKANSIFLRALPLQTWSPSAYVARITLLAQDSPIKFLFSVRALLAGTTGSFLENSRNGGKAQAINSQFSCWILALPLNWFHNLV